MYCSNKNKSKKLFLLQMLKIINSKKDNLFTVQTNIIKITNRHGCILWRQKKIYTYIYTFVNEFIAKSVYLTKYEFISIRLLKFLTLSISI